MRIGYARVSTSSQDTGLQIDALNDHGCEQIYEETGSGSKSDRPELVAVLKALRPGDQLVVWKLDRLSRSLKDLISIVADLESRGVQFVSLTDGIDTTTSTGKLVFHVFGALAEFERNIISERTKAGLSAARSRGRKGGRKPKMTAKQIAMAKAIMDNPDRSQTAEEVAEQFGVSRSTLFRNLQLNG